MKRISLFEFEDFPWYPQAIRKGQTDFLRFMMGVFDVFRAVMPLLKDAMKRSGRSHLMDLCSGGGGSILLLDRYFQEEEELAFSATLTDLYPNVEAFSYIQRQTAGRVDYLSQSVDARHPPEDLQGFWTIFNGFHHFEPEAARGVLATAVARRVPIGVFEPLDKSVVQLVINTLALTLLPLVFTPFIRPFSWRRLLFTYLIPLIPLCTLWDGWASVLRLYGPRELQHMVEALPPNDYHWEVGKASHPFGKVIYLLGYPAPGAERA